MSALDSFAKIDFREQPGSAPDKVVVIIEAEKKSTDTITFSAGFDAFVTRSDETDQSSHVMNQVGGAARVGYRLSDLARVSNKYSLSWRDVQVDDFNSQCGEGRWARSLARRWRGARQRPVGAVRGRRARHTGPPAGARLRPPWAAWRGLQNGTCRTGRTSATLGRTDAAVETPRRS